MINTEKIYKETYFLPSPHTQDTDARQSPYLWQQSWSEESMKHNWTTEAYINKLSHVDWYSTQRKVFPEWHFL